MGGMGPAGGTPPTGGTAGTGPNECRRYAQRYVRTQGTSSVDVACVFDRPSLTLRCTGETVTTMTWSTIDDALRDNRPVGHFTFASQTWDFESCLFSQTATYDSAGRPDVWLSGAQSRVPGEICGLESVYYSAWDAQGRPTHAMLYMEWSDPQAIELCDGQEQSYVYDDSLNTIVMTRFGGTGTSCFDFVATSTFDADGLIVSDVYDDGQPSDGAYTILETGEICRY